MIDIKDIIFRFTFPGAPLALVIYIIINKYENDWYFLQSNTNTNVFLILLALSSLSGYVIQQIWFYFFEKNWGYDNKNREVLKLLNQEIENIPSQFKPLNFNFNDDSQKKWNIVYTMWENLLYFELNDKNKNSEKVLQKLNTTWDFYHANASIVLGLIIANIVYVVYQLIKHCAFPKEFDLVFFVVSIITSIILYMKTIQTRKLVDNLERNFLSIWLNKFRKKNVYFE